MHLKKTFNFSSSASVRQMRAEFSFAWRLSVYNLEILHTMLVMMVVVLMMMVVVVKMMVMVVVMVMMVVVMLMMMVVMVLIMLVLVMNENGGGRW